MVDIYIFSSMSGMNRSTIILPAKAVGLSMLDQVQRHVDKSSIRRFCPLKPTHRKHSRLVCIAEVCSHISRSLLPDLGARSGSADEWELIVTEEHRSLYRRNASKIIRLATAVASS